MLKEANCSVLSVNMRVQTRNLLAESLTYCSVLFFPLALKRLFLFFRGIGVRGGFIMWSCEALKHYSHVKTNRPR